MPYIVKLESTDDSIDYILRIPNELIDELDWKTGDDIELETVLLCETDTETNGIVISNKTR